jgi:hypothetical protein
MATAARRARLAVAAGLLHLASRTPNPKPLSSSAFSSSSSSSPPPTARVREDDLSRHLLRLRFRPPRGAAAAAVERWAQVRGRVSRLELRRAIVQLRGARRYEHALEVGSSFTFFLLLVRVLQRLWF